MRDLCSRIAVFAVAYGGLLEVVEPQPLPLPPPPPPHQNILKISLVLADFSHSRPCKHYNLGPAIIAIEIDTCISEREQNKRILSKHNYGL